jgi:hypothetical protein
LSTSLRPPKTYSLHDLRFARRWVLSLWPCRM